MATAAVSAARKVVVVTGANGGLGYETAKIFYQDSKSYHVFLGSRSIEKGEKAIEAIKKESPDAKNAIELLPLDLASDESITKAFAQVSSSQGHVDTLINNAGLTQDIAHLAGKVSLRESFNIAYDVNVAGTAVMTSTFIPLLLKSSDPRLIFIGGLSNINSASKTYFPTPAQPAGWPKDINFETIAYRSSKLAMNMLMLDYNHKLKADGVKVWSVGPGMLRTNLGGLSEEQRKRLFHDALAHPSVGADIVKRVADGERDAETGKFVAKDGTVIDW